MSQPTDHSSFTSLLDPDGPIALIVKQELAPDDEDDKIIFPPTYPLTTFKGRVQRFEHGEYRVSIELPPDTKRDKDERKDNQKPGYQIDRFSDGTNICEIDSIQSQSNRIEPQFKTIKDGKLVPQITIKVGTQTVNLLDAGHRAADAVIRMSEFAAEFHKAWFAAKSGDLFELAKLAPTTIVFGAWDSRSSQAKLQRLIKAHIRATNVLERTRSAQYTPAADYTALGVIDEDISVGEDDKNNLSQEGMKHALSTQTVGGVTLTAASKLCRTVNINLAAIRQLRAGGEKAALSENATDKEKEEAHAKQKQSSEQQTKLLQEYILGLSLLAAYSRPNLNLREGCNLQTKGRAATKLVQDNRKGAKTLPEADGAVDSSTIESFAEQAAKRFFGNGFDRKDRHGNFESGVAERFLSMSTADRDKVRALGPITESTLKAFAEQGKDPFKLVSDAVKAAKTAIGKAPGKKEPRTRNVDALKPLADALKAMSENASVDEDARQLAKELTTKATSHDDSHVALKEIEAQIKQFKNTKKAEAPANESASDDNKEPE
ncbi:MAG TPA: type I-U CRISPR-associated RAMP protein Csb1/Cas7u [Tepidisphaeraceae bacterium]|nr:type I-U CRISPR-associated RAMP protein Csb1/Cas7u [Tepidisphaeraceae bacterium]